MRFMTNLRERKRDVASERLVYWLSRMRTVVSVVAAARTTLPICLLPVAVAVTTLLVSSHYRMVPTV
jgi:hypothetical protein